jgi:hypothetical protein
MEGIRLAHVSLLAQDGGQGGGVIRPTPIIHTTRTTQRHLSLSNNSPRRMLSRIDKNPTIGTTAGTPQGYYPYVKSCPGGWMRVVPDTVPPGR